MHYSCAGLTTAWQTVPPCSLSERVRAVRGALSSSSAGRRLLRFRRRLLRFPLCSGVRFGALCVSGSQEICPFHLSCCVCWLSCANTPCFLRNIRRFCNSVSPLMCDLENLAPFPCFGNSTAGGLPILPILFVFVFHWLTCYLYSSTPSI